MNGIMIIGFVIAGNNPDNSCAGIAAGALFCGDIMSYTRYRQQDLFTRRSACRLKRSVVYNPGVSGLRRTPPPL